MTSATGTGAKTNKKSNSVVKTVVLEDKGQWVSPSAGEIFYIDEDANLPAITFKIDTDASAPFDWTWKISWPAAVSGLRESSKRGKVLKTFSQSGNFSIIEKSWTAEFSEKVIGGLLSVTVRAGQAVFKRSVYICGRNPDAARVKAYIKTLDNVVGLDTLIEQESKFKHFINADSKPIVAFDGGYGLCQLTRPAPTYEQIWNWKKNVSAGAALYREKQVDAKRHLSQKKREYTDEQLKLETWSRWNGGVYHTWDNNAKEWVRNPNWICDTETGNIGWDRTKSTNTNQTEAELHKRDSDEYKSPPKKSERKWDYTGVCYADHLKD